VSKLGDTLLIADMNDLYRDLIETSNALKSLKDDLSDDAIATEREQLYQAAAAVFGIGEPITQEGRSKRLKGALRSVIGDNPKFGMMQAKILSKNVDGVGRAVITPNPDLSMNEVGIPEDMAWEMFGNFVKRRLVRKGASYSEAVKKVNDRTDDARQELLRELPERQVLLDRAPTWHKSNILSFVPRIADGRTIEISPLIVTGFNADFDGDQMNVHVLTHPSAVQEAKQKMMPSQNLISTTDLRSPRHDIGKEMAMGLFVLTSNARSNKPPRVFDTAADVQRAYEAGEISSSDTVVVRDMS
jgi:DNA-directed RNA polymerase subunit beta'